MRAIGLGNVVGWGRNSSAHGGKPYDTKTGYNLTSWLRIIRYD